MLFLVVNMYYIYLSLLKSIVYIQNKVLVMSSLLVNVLLNALFVMVFVCFTPYESA